LQDAVVSSPEVQILWHTGTLTISWEEVAQPFEEAKELTEQSWHAGTIAPLPSNVSSLAYTAPEILASVGGSNPPSAMASTAADMWALGIVAFELLNNDKAFPEGTPPEAIHTALSGHAPLPWEDGASGAAEKREKMRGMQRLVMPCLSRDPAMRPTAAAVLHSWHNMFDDMKTRGTFEHHGS
jgi:serine/threonine protein kinase